MDNQELREQVRQKYARAITGKTSCCGGTSCCGSSDDKIADIITGGLYDSSETADIAHEVVNASFGCGNPTALAELRPGETVLDLGSGAGLDVLLSARRVGPTGKAYGLDMTDEMLAVSNANRQKAGAQNVEFLKGYIEAIPLPDCSVDVVISNCVINLSADKDQVFREIFRVLKPGGRVAVSDIVTTKPFNDTVVSNLLAWAGCIAGALTDTEYISKLCNAGFVNAGTEVTRAYDLTNPQVMKIVPEALYPAMSSWGGTVASAFIRAEKPVLG